MKFAKKLTMAPLFLVALTTLFYLLQPIFTSYDIIFTLTWSTLVQLLTLTGVILTVSLFFVLFGALSQEWRLIVPVSCLGGILAFLFFPTTLAVVLLVGVLAATLVTASELIIKLKTYLNFQPTSLFYPAVKQFATILLLTISVGFYLSASQRITQQGFQLPAALIDTVLQLAPATATSNNVQGVQFKTSQIAQIPSLNPQQLEMLRKNPDLLKQYGLDPKALDSLSTTNTPANATAQLIKPLLTDQINNLIRPYLPMVPIILAVLLFLTLQTFTSLLSLVISPSLWLVFYLLEKTKFITFTTETREVKKLVV